MLRRLVFLGVAALLLIATGGAMQLGHLSPSAALSNALIAAPTFTPTATPTSLDEPSPPGGLGNSRANLEHVFGGPTGLQGTMIAYRDGTYAATYVDDRATAILMSLAKKPVPLVTARQRVRMLLPTDAVFVGTLGAGPSRIADVYQSARLAAKAPPPLDGSPKGQFVVVFETDRSGAVQNVLATIGRVPPAQ